MRTAENAAPKAPALPSISLPKGGGAIPGLGEKFQSNAITGTGSFSVPLKISPGRSGFTPQLSLSYDTGSGNGVFGLGWNIGVSSISRKTQKGIPRYEDETDSDTFLWSGAEDLVPLLEEHNGEWRKRIREENGFVITAYRPRTEGAFARIEKWFRVADGSAHWQIISRDNVTSVYGSSKSSRVYDPSDERKIFQWFLEKTWDDKGNCIEYEYKREDESNVPGTLSEHGRLNDRDNFSNVYLKRVKYGNTIPVDRRGNLQGLSSWLFEIVLDYGEHGDQLAAYEETEEWRCRQDAFSDYRSGFGIRTYRLCKRVLMFHCFEELDDQPYLVASTSFGYDENPVVSLMKTITHSAYEGESIGQFPPLSFSYTTSVIDPEVRTFMSSGEEVPVVDGDRARWTDLFGEGLVGILEEKNGAWLYKRNVTATGEQVTPAFRNFQTVAERPSLSALSSRGQQLEDIDGDGNVELVVRDKGLNGFYEKDTSGNWSAFRSFSNNPNINWNDPNLRLIDLTGDGHADLLLTEENCFTWYASKVKDGYDLPRSVIKALNEEHGPDLVFSDSSQCIYLADMSGDGLNDIVRIRNGSICYWPNKGYGRFGAKVSMDNSPFFDRPDQFEQKRIRLGDVDGSGTTDILYIGGDTICLWTNQSGNSFSDARKITHTIPYHRVTTVSVIDLLGKGTSCIVYSDPSAPASARLRYIDLMANGKPYLLNKIDNNNGAHTTMHYAPSTKFYLQAEQEGRPWISKLPFPVHVLEKTELHDEITDTKFTTRYAYHHGYYDTHEREFRGFGLVEQWDTEIYAEHNEPEFFVPPVYTKSWYHTGFYREKSAFLRQYEEEYYSGDEKGWKLTDTLIPVLNAEDLREAHRALKGSLLRQEVYAQDGTEKEVHPYTVAESSYALKVIQPKGSNLYNVFLVLPSGTFTYHYERNPADPRMQQQLTLETDKYGTVLRSAAIGYPRRQPEYAEQGKLALTISEKKVMHLDEALEHYRLEIPLEEKTSELTGVAFAGNAFSVERLNDAFYKAKEISFEEEPTPLKIEKRIISQQRITYYSADLRNELPFGEASFHALAYRTFTKAFTNGLIASVYEGRVTDALLAEAGYVKSDSAWWRPSGLVIFDRALFYLPKESLDPFGNRSNVEYDAYALFPLRSVDALGNSSSAIYDYRVLQAQHLTDINDNWQEVKFDVRGMVIATAVCGKNGEGDSLADPTTKLEYELFNWMRQRKPNYVRTLAREEHQKQDTRWQESYTYSDGLGKELLKKVQAEPGPAFIRNPDGSLKKDAGGNPVKENVQQRWIGNGRTILNNKGKPVKKYEPYFTSTSAYEDEKELREQGVSPILHYDPLERVVRTDLPDGTFTMTSFDPWKQVVYDANDTVLDSVWYFLQGAADPNDPEPVDLQLRAAWLAAQHADTPQVTHLDALGRSFISEADNGALGKYVTHSELNITGQTVRITDPKGRVLSEEMFDMTGHTICSEKADAGNRWVLNSVIVKKDEDDKEQPQLFAQWDSRQQQSRFYYDQLQRLSHVVLKKDGIENVVQLTIYGENHPQAKDRNLKGKAYLHFDQAGVTKDHAHDFKGNLLKSSRTFALDYKNVLNWSGMIAISDPLEIETMAALSFEQKEHVSESCFDALNRPIESVAPDGSLTRYAFNEANLLDKVDVRLRGAEAWTSFVENIDYDEKGQRTSIRYANGVKTNYEYDPQSFRLTRLFTVRYSDNTFLQNLFYTYDPVGNITSIRDTAQQTVFFNNDEVEAYGQYTYDALYRLIKAEGRELAGSTGQTSDVDLPVNPLPHSNNTQALRRYAQKYSYDELGNILKMAHVAKNGSWTRYYKYESGSNRLLSTSLPGDDPEGPYSDRYVHDAHGNLISMPHLQALIWDFEDQLREVDLQGGGKAYYVYDAGKQRVRKVVERQGGEVEERFYIGAFELYRESSNAVVQLERETLHIADDKKRIAIVDTKTIDSESSSSVFETTTTRFQFSNHLGSASMELDENAAIISYEEYHPFGTSAYRSGRNETEVKLKRYRYSGKERDEETGLYYYGARYLIAWLGRWCAVDPAGFVDGLNVFGFVKANPVCFSDRTGLQSEQRIDVGVTYSFDSSREGKNDVGLYVKYQYEKQYAEKTFWNTGGDEVVSGTFAAALGIVALIASGPVGWVAGILIAFGIAGGVATAAVGTARLAGSGKLTPEQNEKERQRIEKIKPLLTVGGMVGGGIGAVIGDEEGLYEGAEIGSTIQSILPSGAKIKAPKNSNRSGVIKQSDYKKVKQDHLDDRLPHLDHTGKIHTPPVYKKKLPPRDEWTRYSKQELKDLANDLEKSTTARDLASKAAEKGLDYGHASRTAKEHQLLKDVRKYLQDMQ